MVYDNEHIYQMPKKIIDKKGIYQFITNTYNHFNKLTNCTLIFDFSSTKYISPNTMSILGLIFTKLKSNSNNIFLRNTKPEIKKLLIKYGFLSASLDKTLKTISQNHIKYETFNADDTDGFSKYLNSQLSEISNNEIIAALKTHLMEIYINVKMHARNKSSKRYKTKEIFTCGFYTKGSNMLTFSIANNGQTFFENIDSMSNLSFTYEYEAIQWSLIESNSTKLDRTGGLGLSMLFNLVNSCNGDLYILSGKGYYEYLNTHNKFIQTTTDFETYFPGTVITIKLPINFIPSVTDLNILKSTNSITLSDILSEVT